MAKTVGVAKSGSQRPVREKTFYHLLKRVRNRYGWLSYIAEEISRWRQI
jgi:hypothetical protein